MGNATQMREAHTARFVVAWAKDSQVPGSAVLPCALWLFLPGNGALHFHSSFSGALWMGLHSSLGKQVQLMWWIANEEAKVWRASVTCSCPWAGALSIPASVSEVRLWAELLASNVFRDDGLFADYVMRHETWHRTSRGGSYLRLQSNHWVNEVIAQFNVRLTGELWVP